jgi:hypothetical protein
MNNHNEAKANNQELRLDSDTWDATQDFEKHALPLAEKLHRVCAAYDMPMLLYIKHKSGKKLDQSALVAYQSEERSCSRLSMAFEIFNFGAQSEETDSATSSDKAEPTTLSA